MLNCDSRHDCRNWVLGPLSILRSAGRSCGNSEAKVGHPYDCSFHIQGGSRGWGPHSGFTERSQLSTTMSRHGIFGEVTGPPLNVMNHSQGCELCMGLTVHEPLG